MSGSHDIWIRTFAYDTGDGRPESRLLPIEMITRFPHNTHSVEGSLEFRVGGDTVLSNELLPCGYINRWWEESLNTVADLLALRSSRWLLPGKQCHVAFEMVPGTRAVTVHTVWPGHEPLSPKVTAHVPTLSDAMLAEAGRFFRWLPFGPVDASLARVALLESAPAPWRRR